MRYLEGGSARHLVESQGSLSVERVARLVEHIGSALGDGTRGGWSIGT